jgi:isoleucyl-tRNA synthetase
MEVREDVLKVSRRRARKIIGAPLEARVSLSASGNLYPLLEQYAGDLPALFVVSQVSVNNHDDALKVAIERAAGVKCQRCWKYTTDVGSNVDFPTICSGCSAAVTENLNG